MSTTTREADEAPQTLEEKASSTFVQRLQGAWTEQDQDALEARLARDPAYADAYRRVEESWGELDTYATTPEFMARREKTLVYARHANARRWLNPSPRSRWRFAALAAGVAVALVTVWQFSPYGYRPGLYRTGIGEQRLVDLDDHSRIALDAKTRLQVRYSKDARVVSLQEGQAQFSVAQDPTRPFKVQVGDRTIVALGTVFTVEYVDRKVHVAMMEGRVAVVDSSAADSRELTAGEELRVGHDGRTNVIAQADLEAATAWREGKVIFNGERLSDAVQRLNRYSRLQIEIQEAALGDREISGVFEAGDTQGFVKAVERYCPIITEYTGTQTVRLRMK
jgi:transmembrane sensor